MQRDWYVILSRLNLHQLLAFLMVAEEKSFRAAAQRMHISQSAVSVQVQQLESLLGVPLFHRTTRSVSLTREGSVLSAVAQRVRTDLLDVTLALRSEAKLQRGMVSVAALPTFAHALLPKLMRQYAELHPNVDVRLLDLDSPGALQAVQQGEADMAVVARTEALENFQFLHLFDDELVVLVPQASAEFQGRELVSVQEIALERLVLTPKGAQARTLVDRIFAEAGCKPFVCQECLRPQTLLALVENGFGITVLPRSAVAGIDLSRLKVLRLLPKHIREVGIVTASNLSQSPATQSFKDFLRTTRFDLPEDQQPRPDD